MAENSSKRKYNLLRNVCAFVFFTQASFLLCIIRQKASKSRRKHAKNNMQTASNTLACTEHMQSMQQPPFDMAAQRRNHTQYGSQQVQQQYHSDSSREDSILYDNQSYHNNSISYKSSAKTNCRNRSSGDYSHRSRNRNHSQKEDNADSHFLGDEISGNVNDDGESDDPDDEGQRFLIILYQ